MGLRCVKEFGLFAKWTDSVGTAYFDGKYHCVCGAIEAGTPSNLHQVFDLNWNRLYSYTIPMVADSETLVSTKKAGKLVAIGMTSSPEIWEFDPTIAGYTAGSWTRLDDNYPANQPTVGTRWFAGGADLSDGFYLFGGANGTDIIKTTTFTSWTSVLSIPAAYQRAGSNGFCAHKDCLYIAGGCTRIASPYGANEMYNAERLGYILKYNRAANTLTLLGTDPRFQQIWGDLVSDGTNLWYSYGTAGSGISNTNQLGLLKSTDDGVTWNSVTPLTGIDRFYNFHESHRRSGLSIPSLGKGFFVGGNFCNQVWEVSP